MIRTEQQRQIVNNTIILLDIQDVMEVTGWGEEVTRKKFAYDKEFPAIKIEKKYQVELGALKEYLSKRRTNEEN